MNLTTPLSVQKLQKALHDKAKGSPNLRFYALTTRFTEKMFWHLPTNVARPMVEQQEWMASALRTLRSMG